MELSENVAEYVRANSNLTINTSDSITSLSTVNTPPATPIKIKSNESSGQLDEQRDYVIIGPFNKASQVLLNTLILNLWMDPYSQHNDLNGF